MNPGQGAERGRKVKLHNVQLHSLNLLTNIAMINRKRMSWTDHVARVEDDRIAHGDFEEKPEGKNPFGRPRHRRQDNIKMYLK